MSKKKYIVEFVDEGPACTEADIGAFEKLVGAELPKEYKDYLLKYNGAIPVIEGFDDHACIIKAKLGPKAFACMIDNFLRIKKKVPSAPDLMETWRNLHEDLPPHTVPFARDPGSGLFLISVRKERFGEILFFKLNSDEEQAAFVAESFSAFVANLEPEPEDWNAWKKENL